MLDAIVLDKKYEVVGVVDNFSSFIWTERYYRYGDFEIEVPATEHNLELYQKGYYIHKSDSDRIMLIDSIEYSTSEESGRTMLISGKDASYIMHKRVIWTTTVLNEYAEGEEDDTHNHIPVQTGIKQLLDDNLISPSKTQRKISGFVFKSNGNASVANVKFKHEIQLSWEDNLYDSIESICNDYHIGFKVEFINDKLEFSLYKGLDRSYGQSDNLAVIFSPKFGNLVSSKYLDTDAEYANSGIVAGEKRTETKQVDGVTQSKDLQYTIELGDEFSGMNRSEVYVDQTSLKMYINDIEVPPEKYKNRLRQKGEEAIKKTQEPSVIEAELDYNGQFKYGIDYYLGDIVEVEDEMNRTTKVRIVEMVYCNDLSGERISPAFIDLSEENDD